MSSVEARLTSRVDDISLEVGGQIGIGEEVTAELSRATRKFPTWPTDPLHALAVLGEEFGELTKEVVQLTYEPHKTSSEGDRFIGMTLGELRDEQERECPGTREICCACSEPTGRAGRGDDSIYKTAAVPFSLSPDGERCNSRMDEIGLLVEG